MHTPLTYLSPFSQALEAVASPVLTIIVCVHVVPGKVCTGGF